MKDHTPRAPRRPSLTTALLVCATALGAALAGPPAASALLLEMSVEEMSATASRIVLGEVNSVGSRMDADEGVSTESRVRVLRTLKGRPAGELRVSYPGGSLGPLTVVVPDAPSLAPGMRALFFLDDAGRPIGWRESVLEVRRGEVPRERQSLAHVETRIRAAAALPPEAVPDAPTAPALLDSAVEAAAGPSIGSVSPASASAGTGSVVVITGSGFGGQAGSVGFFYRSGQPEIHGKVVSWSDTRIEVVVPVGYVNGYPGSAGSGPLTVRTAGGESATKDFRVTFGFGGNRWPGGRVAYRVNANGPVPGTKAAVDAAAATWSAAGNLLMVNEGATSVTKPQAGDGNTVSWADLPAGVLGQASLRFYNGQMLETDFAFNRVFTSWGDGSPGTIDLQSVALHEMGHWIDLRDLYGANDAGKVMRGVIGTGVRRRVLTADDAAGPRYAYGAPPATVPIKRLSGADRYATSAAVSRSAFPAAPAVVLATGQDFPDALAASGLAGSYGGPLLLTRRGDLPSEVRSEIVRLKASRVIVVGGASAVSATVARTAAAIPGVTVERVAGADRYETAAAVARRIASREGGIGEAFLVRGDSFADALAVAPYAYSQRIPVLLASQTGLPSASRNVLASAGTGTVVVAGSTSAVPRTAVSALSASTVRVAGANRYETASAMVGYAVSRGWTEPGSVAVATGTSFPDALGGGAAVGSAGGGVLLTAPASLSSPAARRLTASKRTLERVTVLGSTKAVSSAVVSQISLALR
ncbi:MAG: cell wall-binding repeat-containing protein [Coriobacteriia bacterium]|nr:cell wall-binding repeat-containing protein [Coriobacteriia bacterium]